MFECSTFVSDVGNKYRQPVDEYTPKKNIVRSVRMEDFGTKEKITDQILAVVVADGHGSSCLLPSYFVGAYETAWITSRSILQWIQLIYKTRPERFFDEIEVADILLCAFRHARLMCNIETLRGCRKLNEWNIVQAKNDRSNRQIDPRLCASEMDGHYFRLLKTFSNSIVQKYPSAIIDKVLLPHKIEHGGNNPNLVYIPFYVDRSNRLYEIDYGCTATTAVFVQNSLYIAHVGDSDAYLFTRDKTISSFCKYRPIRLVKHHTTQDEEEKSRLKSYGMYAEGRYFCKHIHDKSIGNKGIMPSRSIGHAFLQHYGIISAPALSRITLDTDDIIIIGTDGLWDVYPNVIQIINDIIENVMMTHRRYSQYKTLDPRRKHLCDEIAESIYRSINLIHVPFRDNMMFTVIRYTNGL